MEEPNIEVLEKNAEEVMKIAQRLERDANTNYDLSQLYRKIAEGMQAQADLVLWHKNDTEKGKEDANRTKKK